MLSLPARGLTTGEVAAHFDDVYGASVSTDTISWITDKVIEEMTECQNRPLDRVYPVVFVDALVVKVRDGQVRNKPFYIAEGVTANGERNIHLIRNTFRFASRHYWKEMGKDLLPVYMAPTEAAARERFEEFDAKWDSSIR